MGAADLDSCEQPDELLQLAWKSGFDRKALIRAGSDAAGLLLATELNDFVTRFWPIPRPLEAVDRWSDNTGTLIAEGLRPYGSALFPGCVLGALVAHFFVAPFMSESRGLWAMVFIIFAAIGVFALVSRFLIEKALQRRTANLDETKAFDIVLDQLRRGMVTSPRLVPFVLTRLRKRVAASASS